MGFTETRAACGAWLAALVRPGISGRRLPSGDWRIELRRGALPVVAFVLAPEGGVTRRIAAMLLRAAFTGCRVRPDLVERFAAAWENRPAPCGSGCRRRPWQAGRWPGRSTAG